MAARARQLPQPRRPRRGRASGRRRRRHGARVFARGHGASTELRPAGDRCARGRSRRVRRLLHLHRRRPRRAEPPRSAGGPRGQRGEQRALGVDGGAVRRPGALLPPLGLPARRRLPLGAPDGGLGLRVGGARARRGAHRPRAVRAQLRLAAVAAHGAALRDAQLSDPHRVAPRPRHAPLAPRPLLSRPADAAGAALCGTGGRADGRLPRGPSTPPRPRLVRHRVGAAQDARGRRRRRDPSAGAQAPRGAAAGDAPPRALGASSFPSSLGLILPILPGLTLPIIPWGLLTLPILPWGLTLPIIPRR